MVVYWTLASNNYPTGLPKLNLQLTCIEEKKIE
jgi:hypothetical protein